MAGVKALTEGFDAGRAPVEASGAARRTRPPSRSRSCRKPISTHWWAGYGAAKWKAARRGHRGHATAGYLVDLAAPGADRLQSVFVSDQSTRVACISQNGAYIRPFVSHGSINRNPSAAGLNCSALSGLRAINMS